ncbi:hypothetical protein ACFLTH_11435 [Bacteroidota bacterium]
MRRILKYFKTALSVIPLLIIIISCSNDDGPIISGAESQLISYEGCKFTETDVLLKSNLAPSHQDCIEFRFDSTGVLWLTHVNGAFNCCPSDITADIQISGNRITITEHEADAPCDCICLYDLEYRILNLPIASYQVEVIGMYLGDTLPLQFEMDLTQSANGIYCINRDIYPWSTE